MDYTTNYQLPVWAETDRILMEDFNDSYQKIEGALSGLRDDVDANTSGLSENTAAHAGFGNCQLYATSYVGTGGYGSSNPNSLTFPGTPLAVFIGECSDFGIFLLALRGMQQTFAQSSGVSVNKLTWGVSSLSWYHHQAASGQLNSSGTTYRVVALLDMEDYE